MPGKVWENGKQLLWNEKQIKKYFIRKKGASQLELQALLGIPLTFKDELVGVLLIGTRQEPEYLEQHRPVLSRLKSSLGLKSTERDSKLTSGTFTMRFPKSFASLTLKGVF
jgi:transcriptional regulator with GAF, ATPase, and Fis domain